MSRWKTPDTLDAILAGPQTATGTRAKRKASTWALSTDEATDAKIRKTFVLRPSVIDATLDAAVFLRADISVGELIERALEAEIKRLAKKHNGGKQFPQRKRAPRTGQRPG